MNMRAEFRFIENAFGKYISLFWESELNGALFRRGRREFGEELYADEGIL